MKMHYLFLIMGIAIPMKLWQQGVSIGSTGTPPHPSAALDVNSQTGGVLFPRITTAQRNSITSPAEGLFIFNTDTRCFEYYNNSTATWQSLHCICNYPAPPVIMPPAVTTYDGFTAQWQASPGAIGYLIDVAYDSLFNQLIPGYIDYFTGTGTSVNISGLACDTTVYYRVRPFVNCGAGASSGKMAAQTKACTSCLVYGSQNYEENFGMAVYSDGSYVLGLYAEKVINGNYYGMQIVKMNAAHQVQWVRNIGHSSYNVYLYDLAGTSDGGSIAVGPGYGFYSGSYQKMVAARLDASGNVLWTRAYGINGNYHDYANSVIQTMDGGFVIAGYSSNGAGLGSADMYVVKIDGNGNLQWTRALGTSSSDYGRSVAEAPDGSIYVAGYSNYGYIGGADIFLVKLNSSGSVQWYNMLGGTSYDYGNHVATDSNGDVYIAGYTGSFSGNQGVYVLKVNSTGTLIWAKKYSAGIIGYSNVSNYGKALLVNNGNVYVCGVVDTTSWGLTEMLVMKINASNGNLIRAVRGYPSLSTMGYNIGITTVGGTPMLYASGSVNYGSFGSTDAYMAVMDPDLNGCCVKSVNLTEISGGTTYSAGSNTSGGSSWSGGTNQPGNISVDVICQ